MRIRREKLEQYRDLSISHSELTENGWVDLWAAKVSGKPVEISPVHIIKLLGKFRVGKIDEETFLKWIYTVRWIDLFEFCADYHDSIIGVLDRIMFKAGDKRNTAGAWNIDITRVVRGKEEIRLHEPVTGADIEEYIEALKNNIEL